VSQRLHSRYQRTLADLPWQGRPVALQVQARRFRCLNPSCARQTFAERPAGVAPAAAEPQPAAGLANTPLAHGQPPSGREVARMLMADTDMLSEAGRAFTSNLLAQAAGLAESIAVAKRLNLLLRHKSQESLVGVLDDAAGTLPANFAASMRRDLAAVQAAIDLPWTTSPAEGQINRIKTIKRAMYGRAGFQLLRARVLHAA